MQVLPLQDASCRAGRAHRLGCPFTANAASPNRPRLGSWIGYDAEGGQSCFDVDTVIALADTCAVAVYGSFRCGRCRRSSSRTPLRVGDMNAVRKGAIVENERSMWTRAGCGVARPRPPSEEGLSRKNGFVCGRYGRTSGLDVPPRGIASDLRTAFFFRQEQAQDASPPRRVGSAVQCLQSVR